MDEIPELSAADFERAISAHTRRRLAEGVIHTGDDVVTIRRFVGLTTEEFAQATGVDTETVQNWESGHQPLDGPAVRLLRIAVRHPGVFRESLRSAV
jgi:DNA-binding transcriptional regulator YiaG